MALPKLAAKPSLPSHRRARAIRLAAMLAALSLAAFIAIAPQFNAGPRPALAATGRTFTALDGLAIPPKQPDLGSAFAQAAATYDVPVDLLKAIAYYETGFVHDPDSGHDIPLFGVMGLTMPPAGNTLPRAAAILGVSEGQLRADAATNIKGAAAVLRALANEQSQGNRQVRSAVLEDWYAVVAAYGGMADPVVARSYAFSVFQVLASGAQAVAGDNERLSVAPHGPFNLPDRQDPLLQGVDSIDYPDAHWVAANSGNYEAGRDYGSLNFIVIHDTEGTYQSAINWFQNPASGVSAHYVFRSSDGDLTQMVRHADTGYHAGNWDYNVRSIGIEHEGYMNNPSRWYTPVMYDKSANLVRTIADRYGILKDHAHIVGHYQVPNQRSPHVDPGPGWDWPGYLAKVRRDWAAVATVDNTAAGFAASPSTIDAGSGWRVYGAGYGGSSSYSALSTTGSATNSGAWNATLPSAGAYDLYAFIPWVDNDTPETTGARYTVYTAGGPQQVTLSQKAITDAGDGRSEWMHVGRFNFGAYASVSLSNQAADSGKNVWFDAMMWIPTDASVPEPTPPASTSTPTPTATRPPFSTGTPNPTDTPQPTATETAIPQATWTPGPCGMRFLDLPDSDWSYGFVSALYCRGIIGGYADGTFRPGNPATRAQLAKMLVLAKGWTVVTPPAPTFSDVPADDPFYLYVETAAARHVISGYADGTFKPYNTVTRAQFSKMIVLANDWWLVYPSTPSFADVASTDWAYGYVEAARARSIISGYADGTFRPGNTTTRSQIAKMLSLAVP